MKAQPPVFVSEMELKEAESKFSRQDYAGALPVFLIDERKKTNDALLKYKIGVCYFNSTNQKLKATEYFEFVLKNKTNEIPNEIYYYLGRCYHYSYQFIAAINMFNTYLESYQNRKPLFSDVAKMILICDNAAKLYSEPLDNVSVSPLDVPVNTSYNDYAAYTSGNNGNYLIFSSSRRKDSFNFVFGNDYVYLPDELKSRSEDIYMAYRRGIGWTHPYPAELDGKICYPLSITNDGKEMILYKGEDEINGDIFIASVKKSRWGNLRKLSTRINSRYSEKGACFAGNNKVIYFSSNRPGGFGGYDIYKSYQIGKEEWSEPINLGATVNTEVDEIFPFMHPDNKTLYFSCNGRNTMGGSDIFYTISEGAGWKEPSNLGYPINSTFDEICFFQGNDRKYSYVSSNRISDEALGGFDVIRIFRPEKKVPRAMVTGKIIAVKSGTNVPLTLKVKDLDTGEPQQYIYNPDIKNGGFFMILAPKKNYQVAIYYEGIEVNTLSINIPADTYNYELNHEMDFTPIDLLGAPVGESVSVRNTDSKVTKLQDLSPQDSIRDNRYDALLHLMEMIIDRKDVQGLANLNELEKPIKEAFLVDTRGNRRGDIDEYYTPLIELVEKALLNADANLLEKLENAQSSKQYSTVLFEDKSNVDKSKKLIKRHAIWFQDTKIDLEAKQKGELLQIIDFLKNQPNIKIEVLWFSTKSETGMLLNNEELSKKRASTICDFLQSNNIATKRFSTIHKELYSNQNDTQKLELLIYESL
jgi:outer membrane protein OmpA-like peptidoglycan-associated protein